MDLTSMTAQRLNPFPWYRQMREHNPVYFNEERGSWAVFRYNDVQRVLTDYNTFSSQYMGEQQPLAVSHNQYRPAAPPGIALAGDTGVHAAQDRATGAAHHRDCQPATRQGRANWQDGCY